MLSSEILDAVSTSFSVFFQGKNFIRLLMGLWVTISIAAVSVVLSPSGSQAWAAEADEGDFVLLSQDELPVTAYGKWGGCIWRILSDGSL